MNWMRSTSFIRWMLLNEKIYDDYSRMTHYLQHVTGEDAHAACRRWTTPVVLYRMSLSREIPGDSADDIWFVREKMFSCCVEPQNDL